MDLRLYNHLSNKKEKFKPIKSKKVGLYTCGPTVYDRVHIGNLRTYIFEDILHRTLKYNDYKVNRVMNITDIEDKIIKKMRSSKKTLKQITLPHTKSFFEDLKLLNIIKPDKLPKATEHISQMIKIINKLLEKKIAYKAEDDSIYFNIDKFENYGKLSGIKKMKAGKSRIHSDEYNKEHVADFVLWKAAKSNEPSWDASFGKGRPGWHIECSAMSMKYLGKTFDIHAGAIDLLFPHHENETAQSEAATGKKFVNYWLEGEHLLVDSKKMAKSTGNFYTIVDVKKRHFNPLAFRYLVLTSHYRSKLNFTWKSLKAAESALTNLEKTFLNINTNDKQKHNSKHVRNYEQKFLKSINDDLNTPKAISILWAVVKDKKLSGISKRNLLLKFDKVLGLGLKSLNPVEIPSKIKKLAEEREEARSKKDFKKADLLRNKALKLGWALEDTPEGTKAKKI